MYGTDENALTIDESTEYDTDDHSPNNVVESTKYIDCSTFSEEEFTGNMRALKGNTDYFVRAFVITSDGNIKYGEIKKIHTNNFNRSSSPLDFANVWQAFTYTLFDLVTDEIIDPNKGYYYSTNENPSHVVHTSGTGFNTCYKFKTERDYKLWYTDVADLWGGTPIHKPIMTYSNGKLTIEKNPLDTERDVTIYYQIGGDGKRQENITKLYSAPISVGKGSIVYCYGTTSDGMYSWTNSYKIVTNATSVTNPINITTKIFSTGQPPIVGGTISNYSSDIIKKGIIVSTDKNTDLTNASDKDPLTSSRVIDCTDINEEQFYTTVVGMLGNTTYYVKAFAETDNGDVYYGNTETITSQNFSRNSNVGRDYANVWHAFSYTLFDLVTDEIIDPSADGFYYSTNENPTYYGHQYGTGYNTCYKFRSTFNYQLWYEYLYGGRDRIDIDRPVMTYSNGKLKISKSADDVDKNITFYYSINGDYFRPEYYKDVYTEPIEVEKGQHVVCYGKSSDDRISYVNIYVIGNDSDNNYTGIKSIAVDAQFPVKGIYDLQGRKVDNMVPGNLYIVNGKKIVK